MNTWKVKNFKSFEAQHRWISKNKGKYQIVIIYVNNGFAVEYKLLNKKY